MNKTHKTNIELPIIIKLIYSQILFRGEGQIRNSLLQRGQHKSTDQTSANFSPITAPSTSSLYANSFSLSLLLSFYSLGLSIIFYFYATIRIDFLFFLWHLNVGVIYWRWREIKMHITLYRKGTFLDFIGVRRSWWLNMDVL